MQCLSSPWPCRQPVTHQVVLADLDHPDTPELITRTCEDCLVEVGDRLLDVGGLVYLSSSRSIFKVQPASHGGGECESWRVLDIVLEPVMRCCACSWPGCGLEHPARRPAVAAWTLSVRTGVDWPCSPACPAHTGSFWRELVRRNRGSRHEPT